MSGVTTSTFGRYKSRWEDCTECELCETRRRVVLYRGKIPCDILFVGEAPGYNEDTTGRPFIGPAGQLLDRLIGISVPEHTRLGFTNLIACIPLDALGGGKLNQPHKDHILACADRLQEIVTLARPRAVVQVGKLAEQYLPKVLSELPAKVAAIIHPAAILRAPYAQQGLRKQEVIVTLADLCEEL